MRSKIINISLPEPLLKDIDKFAGKEARNRSDFFREAARSYITSRQKLESLYAYGQAQAKKMGVKTEADVEKVIAEFRAKK